MTNYLKNARSVINNFLWDGIKENNILDEDDYRPDGFTKSIIPIIPTQEIPEFNNLLSGKTYIVYDFEISGYDEDWWMCYETITYSIISEDYSKMIELFEFMIDLFRRKDISGKELQISSNETDYFKFFSTCIDRVSSPDPYDFESGMAVATIEISYKYSRIIGDEGRYI